MEGIFENWSDVGPDKGLRLAAVQAETGELLGHANCDWEWDPHTPDLAVVIAPALQAGT